MPAEGTKECFIGLYLDLEPMLAKIVRQDADEVLLLDIPTLGISIPWPEGVTAREALDLWVFNRAR